MIASRAGLKAKQRAEKLGAAKPPAQRRLSNTQLAHVKGPKAPTSGSKDRSRRKKLLAGRPAAARNTEAPMARWVREQAADRMSRT